MPRTPLLDMAAAAALALAAAAAAQGRGETPTATVYRLAAGEQVRVDGHLDEPLWQRAGRLGELRQSEPVAGAPAAQPTEVLLAHDRDALYLAIVCHDDPALVRARLMDRDARLDPDDRVELWVDTFADRRFAYWFQIGAGGSKGDALVADSGRSFNKSWDGIWFGRARVTAHGWQAEIALPFKTMAFREGLDTWGFNLRRLRKEGNSEDRWAGVERAYRFFDLTVGGDITGLGDLHHGLGIDVAPYATVRSVRDASAADDSFSTEGEFGADLSYRVTPALNMRLTYNTDFAETEVDERQINITRFPLFFPEKRDFFLEDNGQFEFGAPARRSDTIPFFSRTIGRDPSGATVPILFGAKLTGRAGPWNLGLLHATLDEFAGREERGVGVARISYNLGGENAVGGIFTGGRPQPGGDAATYGVDVRLGDSDLFGPGRSGTLWAYAMQTEREGSGGEGGAYGFHAVYRDDAWDHQLSSSIVGDGFAPALGFVRRTGVQQHRLESSYTWWVSDGTVRRIDWRLAPTLVWTDEGEKDQWAVPWRWFEVQLTSEDSLEFESHRIFERLSVPFEIRPGVFVPAGDYTETRHFATLQTSEARLASLTLDLETGGFYDGNLTRWRASTALFLSRHLQLSGGYEEFHVRLDGGRFTTRVFEGRIDAAFSPQVSWKNLVQYDTDSKQLGAQSRLRWIVRPGSDLFLVAVLGWERRDRGAPLTPSSQDLALKVIHTLRF